ncbi:MAG: c-type cytochrome [Hydrogenophilales bacterium]|nr:c-type cytochrome [Hydrogenophilales bacterium]
MTTFIKSLARPISVAAIGVFLISGGKVQAAPGGDEVVAYERRVNEIQASAPGVIQKKLQVGKKAAFFCANCHGDVGLSKMGHVPNLAGQNPVYLMMQIQKFADGRRKDDFMSGLIKALKDEDRLGMALFYASQAVPPGEVGNARQAQRGRALYMRACIGCHGASAHGNRNVARLAGQQSEYLVASLTNYRKRTGQRTDPSMTSVAANLNDEQIAALAEYLTTLP